MKKRTLILLAVIACSSSQFYAQVDKNATKETFNLYKNLTKIISLGIMFGHQHDLAYGYHGKYQASRSDIKEVTGDYPAVYGLELGRLEIDNPWRNAGPRCDGTNLVSKRRSEGGVV